MVPMHIFAAEKMERPKSSTHYPFWFGGSATCMATCVTHPLELVKVRMQTCTPGGPTSLSKMFCRITKAEGIFGLYNGISASLLRQLTYSTVRFGLYEEMKQRADPEPTFPLLCCMAMSSGAMGGLTGNFADIVNVRMQNDAALPRHLRRNYHNVMDGMIRIAREEGILSYFRGCVPNSSRAAIITASQLATYDVAKQMLIKYTSLQEDTLATQLAASFLAGVAAATAASPLDVIKTRVMSSTRNQGIWEVIQYAGRMDGARWMFRGWVPNFLRQGPHTICIFIFLELHRKIYRRVIDQ